MKINAYFRPIIKKDGSILYQVLTPDGEVDISNEKYGKVKVDNFYVGSAPKILYNHFKKDPEEMKNSSVPYKKIEMERKDIKKLIKILGNKKKLETKVEALVILVGNQIKGFA